ncbi:Chitinase 4 [Zancudomyces culisetae]|uniref:Chitinase 4 n=1 Tax=Zancudomyces culisetae TaxID=1213189 RepID=A0A1R1PP56_ZANCU|nr:Chitinase 4 [Zancudomyces culisetae]|eukprot:OMH82721.1 Chitinase 4 [Zancudomyces culisetae]
MLSKTRIAFSILQLTNILAAPLAVQYDTKDSGLVQMKRHDRKQVVVYTTEIVTITQHVNVDEDGIIINTLTDMQDIQEESDIQAFDEYDNYEDVNSQILSLDLGTSDQDITEVDISEDTGVYDNEEADDETLSISLGVSIPEINEEDLPEDTEVGDDEVIVDQNSNADVTMVEDVLSTNLPDRLLVPDVEENYYATTQDEQNLDTSIVAPIPSETQFYTQETPAVQLTDKSSTSNNFGLDCVKFVKAVMGSGYPTPTDSQCNAFLSGLQTGEISSAREAAMFLAQIMHESDGLKAKSEYRCATEDCTADYAAPGDYPGKAYYGRGYIQLSWADNYKAASKALYGDDRLYTNPDSVAQDETIAWQVSFWYWKSRVRTNKDVLSGEFGASTRMINGALECTGSNIVASKTRYDIYKQVLSVFDPSSTPTESGCYN